MYRFL